MQATNESTQPNPFRSLHKKEKDQHQSVAASLKVERVKYKTTNNMSPADESKVNDDLERGPDQRMKETLRPKGVRRAGAPGQTDRTRQPPNHR